MIEANRYRSRRARTRGALTVLVVMALLSITLAMAYAIMRSQTTGLHLQSNTDRKNMARQAAVAGLTAALRSMRLASWSGVGSTLAASLNATDSYSVTFAAGDPWLVPGSPNYAKYPYRVTLVSTGTSVNPAQAGISTTYQAQAVVELVPRGLAAAPTNWSTIRSYTLYQLKTQKISIAVPCHIEGPVRLQGEVELSKAYAWSDTVFQRYLSDLAAMRLGVNEVQRATNYASGGTFRLTFMGQQTAPIAYNASSSAMQSALQALSTIGSGNVSVSKSGSVWTITFVGQLGQQDVASLSVSSSGLTGLIPLVIATVTTPGGAAVGDYRPFSGPVNLRLSQTNSTNQALMSNQLALTLNDIPYSPYTLSFNTTGSTYKLYPGGPSYSLGALPASVSNATLGPDPITNPLGIYYRSGSVTFGNNVTVSGTIVVGSSLTITGTNVQIQPVQLTPMAGTSSPVRLPSLICFQELKVVDGASASFEGTVHVGTEITIEPGTENTAFSVVGNVVVAEEFTLKERTEWMAYSGNAWDQFYTTFVAQLGVIPYFPQWMNTLQGRDYVPRVNLQPDTSGNVAHYHSSVSVPIYAIGSGDSGLHWDLVSWTNHP